MSILPFSSCSFSFRADYLSAIAIRVEDAK